jgi:pilus assembly protein CpaE
LEVEMSDPIRAIVLLAEDADRDVVESAVGYDAAVDVVAYSDSLGGDWQSFLSQPSDLVIVACGAYSDRVAYLIDRAVKQRPDRPVVLMSQSSPNGLLRQAFEAGADDVVSLPQAPEAIQFAIEKVLARRRGAASIAGKPTAPLVTVLGPKGGTGKTLISANLAVALARRDMNVVLVDLDLQFGDVGLALGLSPSRTMYDLMKAGPPFDHEKLDRHLIVHASGVKVLVAPTRPDHASAVSIDYLRDVYASLRTMCDIVIVDTPPGFTPEVIATIDVSTSAVMVGMLDSLSLKNTKLGIETLDLMGYPAENMALVLNRADSRVGITHDDVAAIIGRAPDVFVPSDREIPRSVNEGTPIVASRERSEAAKAFRQLADRFAREQVRGPAPAMPADAGKTLLGRRRR